MKKTSFKIQIAFSFFMQVINYIVPLLVAPYISRVLLDKGIGDYAYAYSLTAYFTLFTSFGFDGYGNKEISNSRNDKHRLSVKFWNIIGSKYILLAITSLIYFSLIFQGALNNGVDLKIYIALWLVIWTSALDISFYYYGLEKVKTITIVTFIVNVMYMIGIFCFVKSIEDLLVYTILKSGIKVVIYIILWIMAWKDISKINVRKEFHFFSTMREVFPFFLPGLIAVFANMIDQTMLGKMVANTQVGYYQQAYKLISLPLATIGCLNPLILSRISYLTFENQRKEIEEKVLKSFQLMNFIGIPSAFGLYAISRFFIPLFYGEAFIPSVRVVYFLIPTIVLSPLINLWMYSYFYPAGKANLTSIAMAIGNVINIALNVVLIHSMKASGAALATSISNAITFGACFIMSHKDYTPAVFGKALVKPVVSAGLMIGVLIPMQKVLQIANQGNFVITVASIIVGAAVYLGSCFVLKEDFMVYMLTFIRKFKRRGTEL